MRYRVAVDRAAEPGAPQIEINRRYHGTGNAALKMAATSGS